jgi:1-acyl-sn-glycerol-3-phosphate acyltransferase
MVNMPKAVSVIVHANNVSMPVLGSITPYLGALPLPDDADAAKNFMRAVEHRIRQKNCVMIYPEAHIWPYYTDIRPFQDLSFRYPVQYHVPAFCLTNTYQKRKAGTRPKIVTYIDGPFYPDETLPVKEQKKELRTRVYETMKNRAANSNVTVIRYEKERSDD